MMSGESCEQDGDPQESGLAGQSGGQQQDEYYYVKETLQTGERHHLLGQLGSAEPCLKDVLT